MEINEAVEEAKKLLKQATSLEEESTEKLECIGRAINYFNKCINKFPFVATLYYERAFANKMYGNSFQYFLDVSFSKSMGFPKAQDLFNDLEFQSDNSIYLKEDFILSFEFAFDITNPKKPTELSYSMTTSKLHIRESKMFSIDIDSENQKISYSDEEYILNAQSIFYILYQRLKICSIVCANNINSNKTILESFGMTELLNLLESKTQISIVQIANRKIDSKINDIIDAYNSIFPHSVTYENCSLLKNVLTMECYKYFKNNKIV